jgi:hypothetical protein
MTGEFVAQLTDIGRVGIFVGSLMHVVGLVAAVVGGVGCCVARGARVSMSTEVAAAFLLIAVPITK